MLSRIGDPELKDALTFYAREADADRMLLIEHVALLNSGVIDAPIRLKTESVLGRQISNDDFEVESVDWETMRQSLPHLQTILKMQAMRAQWHKFASDDARKVLRLVRLELLHDD
ncbi:hypothetical protein NOR51B_745 [Luminiphilus syltensis NOR5-1B]|uniref:Uncharacterized protein n=1 Tax=Luminiphilus syltensis NOR5-1B TaxID=565045 RepID=B8KSH1_9GAMM|nr:hypothetical protein NOR51B_745 [Luminiphilus syltensis NOR5-1B]